MPIDTDLNTFPYYDDFDETKNFHKVLFRPSVPIQARELTQLQSILQNQVERFGDSVYSQGSIIKGCGLFFDNFYAYVKILDLQADGETVAPANYANCFAVDATSNLTGEVVNFLVGSEARDPETNKLFISYINTGNNEKKVFANSDTLTIFNKQYTVENVLITNPGTGYSNDNYLTFTGGGGTGASANLVTYSNGSGIIASINITNKGSGYVTAPTVAIVNSSGGSTVAGSGAALTAVNFIAQVTVAGASFTAAANTTGTSIATIPVGLATAVYVKEGIIYQKGHFVRVDEQVTIVDPHFTKPNNVVLGFTTTEEIVDSDEDTSLLDNATGFSNYTAPGAHRLKLTANLIALTKEEAAANSNFLSIVEYEDGSVTKRRKDPDLNSIGKIIAERTKEESGDYVTTPFSLLPEDISGNTTHLNLNVGKGTGYVSGYRVDLLDTIKLPLRKADDSIITSSQSIAANYGNYVLVNEVLGTFVFTSGATVNLRDTAGTAVTNTPGGAATTPGNKIGEAKIRSMLFDSGVIGTPSATYRIYLFDIRMTQSYSFKNVRSIQMSGGVADCVLEDSVAVLKETEYDFMTFPSGFSSVKQFYNESLILRRSSNTNLDVAGQATITLTSPESWAYANGALNDTQELDFVVIPKANTDSSTNLTGTVTSNSTGWLNSGSAFVSELDVGDYIKFQSNSEYYRVASIANNTHLQLANNGPNPVVSANTFKLAFPKNIPINLRRTGSSANISISGSTVTIYVGTALSATANTVVYHNVKASPTTPKTKTVKRSVYVKLSTDTLKTSLKGPWCLGIPDAFKLNGVFAGTSNSYGNTSTNYADSFELISGQTDNYYGLSYLKLRPGATSPSLTTSSCLTIDIDCFTHAAGYYISTESYPVSDASNANTQNTITTQEIPVFPSSKYGLSYSQRDIIDFRPIITSTANITSILSASNTNISNTQLYTVDPSNTEVMDTSSVFYPAPNENFSANVEYFMSRGDRVVMDVFGNFSIIEGVPSNNPSVPPAPRSTMSIGSVFIPPYPSLGPESSILAKRPDYAVRTKLLQTKNYTMSDIGKIEERVSRLEYYSLLNTVEKNTKDLIIPSSANASINRFKNGFFADPMISYDIANPGDPEFTVTIDTTRGGARPQLYQNMFQLELASNSNVVVKGDLALLEYDEVAYIDQPIASRFRNITQSRYSYRGGMLLYPPYDNYYDTTRKAVDVSIDTTSGLKALAKAVSDNFVGQNDKKVIHVEESGFKNIGASNGDNPGSVITSQNKIDTTVQTFDTSLGFGKDLTTVNEVGGFLTESTLNPFLRAQSIGFIVHGLRPEARHYAYFAKKAVTARPGIVSNTELVTNSTNLIDNPAFSFTDVEGANLVANSSGMIAGAVIIPAGEFFCGQNELMIVDSSTLASLDTATSSATTVFNSFNFKQGVTNLSITTKTVGEITGLVGSSNGATSSTFQTKTRQIPRPPPPPPQPAQRFCCFIAGTQIAMADGTTKNIENVEIGEKLIGKDNQINTVLSFVRPVLGDRTLISINGSNPFITNDHPVYCQDGMWRSFNPEATKSKYQKLRDWNIGKLSVGDIIDTLDGTGVKVKTLTEHNKDSSLQVYNFSLDGNHTYIANDLVVHNKCFIAGTEVLLEDNTWKKIEDVRADEVLIGKDGSKNKILRLHRPTLGLQDHILPHKLRLACINGKEYSASEDHIFSTESGWKAPNAFISKIIHKHTIEAEGFDVTDLQVGDKIVTDDGRTVEVKSLEFKEDDPSTQLYNFWTDGNHTYHVKMAGHDDGMLVHNKCFIKGTEVLMQDGTWKNIEDIKLGDILLGHSGTANEVVQDHSQPISTRERQPIWYGFNGTGGFVTAAHPILTKKGWRAVDVAEVKRLEILPDEDVQQLEVGDEMLCKDGESVLITSIEEYHTSPDDIGYNHGLTGDHTYFVRMPGTDKWLIAHNRDPISQTFQIGIEEAIAGTFITKVEVFLKEKDTGEAGLTLQLRNTDNGTPATKVLAEKHLKQSEINVSEDASLPTTFEFDTPAFVASLDEYCIVVIPDGNSPNYIIWTAAPGLPDVTTGIITNADWGDGTMFLGANDRVWTPYQNEDLKFKIYTTKFTQESGTVTLVNKPYEFLTLSGIEGAFAEGEQVAQKATTYLPGTYTVNAIATFNSLTGVSNTTEFITTTAAHDFGNGERVRYLVSAGNTAVTNLTNSGIYFVTSANSTALKLSTTADGPAINLTAGTSETGHKLVGLFPASVLTVDNTDLTSLVSEGDYLLFIYGNNRSAAKTGTVTVTAASNVVVGVGTSVNTEYTVGDYILVGNTTAYEMREITGLTNTTHLTVDCNFNTSLSANVHFNIQETFQVNRVNRIGYSSPNSTLRMKDFPENTIDNGIANSTNGYVGVQKVVKAVVDRLNKDNSIVLKDTTTSNTTFRIEVGRKLVGSSSEASATVASIDDFKINYTEPHIITFIPPGNSITLKQNVVQAGNTLQAATVGYNTAISFGVSNKVPYEGYLRSKSNEVFDTDKSIVITASMSKSSLSSKIGPVFDLQPAGMVGMSNIINDDITDETTKDGNADAKYISKKVVLLEGLDAEDIKVYVTAHKPPQSDVYVYAKLLNGSDSDNFEDKDWTLLVQETPSLYSDSGNEQDYLEYVYTFNTTPPSRVLPGKATISTSSNTITGLSTSFIRQFNSNTDVSSSSNYISLTDANTYFRNGEKTTYFTAASNTVVSGLANATVFFVVNANTTTLQLSSTPNGTAIDITGNTTASGASTNGHFLSVLSNTDMIKISNTSGYEINFVSGFPITNTSFNVATNPLTTASGITIEKVTQEKAAFKYNVDSGIVRYYDSVKALQKEYKTYAIKIILASTDSSFPPIIKDVRAIAVSI